MPISEDRELSVLLPRLTAQRLTRRSVLRFGVAGAIAGGVFLAGCGGDDGGGGGGGGGVSLPDAKADGLDGDLFIYTWADYHDLQIIDRFSADNGIKLTLDVYDSNEQAIAKLELAKGSSGYDIVVPTGPYIPQMIQKGLISKLDRSLLPNFSNLDPTFAGQPWDPGNEYSVCKAWGSTGYVYDASRISGELVTWKDFVRVAQTEASGQTSVLAVAPDFAGIYFWGHGIDWTTEDPADLDAAEQYLLTELVPHIKAFDSYPGPAIVEGTYALSQAFTGDARRAVSEDPERFKWVLGAPKTEIWMDNWAIVAGAKHPRTAHAFINYMLIPEVAAFDTVYHGYDTGVKGVKALAEQMGIDHPEIVFLTAEQVATMEPGAVNSAQNRLVDIFNRAKAAAGA